MTSTLLNDHLGCQIFVIVGTIYLGEDKIGICIPGKTISSPMFDWFLAVPMEAI